jgi:beta-ureidopropionase / N-carbamoyl-L-amino-acid hydrolase
VAGHIEKGFVHGVRDREGNQFGRELEQIGYLGEEEDRPLPASAYLELHIEQGPVLEASELPVGVVGGIVGITWSEVTVTGQSDHAGPTPMNLRRDAVVAAAGIIGEVERIAKNRDEIAVATVGRVAVEPNVINTIPGKVTFSVDFRHPDVGVLEAQVDALNRVADDIAGQRDVAISVDRFWTSEPTPFDSSVVEAIRLVCGDLGLQYGELWSGAGHDAKYMADVCPSGMIFVRSKGGLSHCEVEESSPEDIEAGANVLLRVALRLAKQELSTSAL